MSQHAGSTSHAGQGPALGAAAHPAVGHLVPWQVLAGVCAALLVLTWLTVSATWIDMGRLNLWIALVIATVKAALVVLYFMHLRYDRPFNALVLIASLAFVALFIGLALLDSTTYQGELIWEQAALRPRQ